MDIKQLNLEILTATKRRLQETIATLDEALAETNTLIKQLKGSEPYDHDFPRDPIYYPTHFPTDGD